jgi:hypothetical protein
VHAHNDALPQTDCFARYSSLPCLLRFSPTALDSCTDSNEWACAVLPRHQSSHEGLRELCLECEYATEERWPEYARTMIPQHRTRMPERCDS